MARKVTDSIRDNPAHFSAPMGFLLVTNLDDASRNAALCNADPYGQALIEVRNGNAAAAYDRLHIAQTCLDSSVLLYSVSQSAFSMYSQYLQSYARLVDRMSGVLDQCTTTLKNGKPR